MLVEGPVRNMPDFYGPVGALWVNEESGIMILARILELPQRRNRRALGFSGILEG
jgi:hypothetical protein